MVSGPQEAAMAPIIDCVSILKMQARQHEALLNLLWLGVLNMYKTANISQVALR